MNIQINDTHRLPYSKGKLTAIKLGSGQTTPVEFFDQDEQSLGYTVYTNSQGFVCDANGNLLGNGTFVHEDAVITCTYNGAQVAQWVVKANFAPTEVRVNDGKLLNKNGDVVWSANSSGNYTLKYSDIQGTPTLNEWTEDEQDIVIPRGVNPSTCEVGKHTKVLVVGSELDASTPYANLYLTPEPGDPQRFGQVFFVKNMITEGPILQLMNANASGPFCKIGHGGSAVVALLSNGDFTALSVSGEDSVNFDLGSVVTNQQTFVSDDTPGVIAVSDTANSGTVAFCKVAVNASMITKPRKIVLIWQPNASLDSTCKKLKVFGKDTDMVQYTGIALLELMPYCPCECIVKYDTSTQSTQLTPLGYIEKRTAPIMQTSPTAVVNNGTTRATLGSAATCIDLQLTGGENPDPSVKKVFPAVIDLPQNFEGDVMVQSTTAWTAENFEIQVGFRCNQTALMASYTAGGVQNVPVYRSSAGDGANKGKFFALFHVLTLTAGGIFVCYNPATPES